MYIRWKLLCEYNEGIDGDSIVGKEKLLLNFQLHKIVNKDLVVGLDVI